eukprot:1048727_1
MSHPKHMRSHDRLKDPKDNHSARKQRPTLKQFLSGQLIETGNKERQLISNKTHFTTRMMLVSLLCVTTIVQLALAINTHYSHGASHQPHLIKPKALNTSNASELPYKVITFNDYKIINGITIPTRQEPDNWRGYGLGINCSYGNNNVINISTWRQDGTGANLGETMKFIAFRLSNPSKYHFYYFPWLYFVHFDTGKVDDLTQMAQFMNIGSRETNIFDEPCTCCIWGQKVLEMDPKLKHLARDASKLFNQTVRQYLRTSYDSNKQHLDVYRSVHHCFNVALHIRRGDLVDHAKLSKLLMPDIYFTTIMNYLFWKRIQINASQPVMFHVHSQSNFDGEEFENLLQTTQMEMFSHPQFMIKYYLGTALNLTFHGLVTADAFVASRSDLSYSAAILSRSKYIFYPYRTRPLDHWIRCTVKPRCYVGGKIATGTQIL